MKPIKPLFIVTLAVTLSCATLSTWWQNFEKDPVAQIQEFEQEVTVILTDVQAAWTVLSPFLGPVLLAKAQPQYANAVAAVGHAEGVLMDTVKAAVAAQTTPVPDFTGLINAVSDAASQLVALVDSFSPQVPSDAGVGMAYTTNPPTFGPMMVTPSNPPLTEAKARVAALKTFAVHAP